MFVFFYSTKVTFANDNSKVVANDFRARSLEIRAPLGFKFLLVSGDSVGKLLSLNRTNSLNSLEAEKVRERKKRKRDAN